VSEPDLDRKRAAIVGAPIFRGLSTEAVDDLAHRMTARRYEESATVVSAEDTGNTAHLILVGRVDTVVYSESRQVTLSIERAGDWFGDEAMFGVARPITARIAIEPTVTLTVASAQLLFHLDHHPGTALHLIRHLARRLRRTVESIALFTMASIEARFARQLAQLVRMEGVRRDGGFELVAPPTQQELADLIGTRRETVSRLFGRLMREGHLVRRGTRLFVTSEFLDTRGTASFP
jgi:CRP-like cAMP-binding protein